MPPAAPLHGSILCPDMMDEVLSPFLDGSPREPLGGASSMLAALNLSPGLESELPPAVKLYFEAIESLGRPLHLLKTLEQKCSDGLWVPTALASGYRTLKLTREAFEASYCISLRGRSCT